MPQACVTPGASPCNRQMWANSWPETSWNNWPTPCTPLPCCAGSKGTCLGWVRASFDVEDQNEKGCAVRRGRTRPGEVHLGRPRPRRMASIRRRDVALRGRRSEPRLKRLGHFAKQAVQGWLHHHFGEGVELRVAADFERAPVAVGVNTTSNVNFTGVGALVAKVNTVPSVAEPSEVRSKWMPTPPVTLKEQDSPFPLEVGDRTLGKQGSEAFPLLDVAGDGRAIGVQRHQR